MIILYWIKGLIGSSFVKKYSVLGKTVLSIDSKILKIIVSKIFNQNILLMQMEIAISLKQTKILNGII